MSSFSSCPKCAKPITLPRGAEPADMVRCPLCQAEYMLAEALANAPPELLVLRSLGVISREEPHDAPASAGAADLHLFDHASPDLSDGPVIDLSDSPQIADDHLAGKFDADEEDLSPSLDLPDEELAPKFDMDEEESAPKFDMSDDEPATKFDPNDEDTVQGTTPFRDARQDQTGSLDTADQDTEVEQFGSDAPAEESFDFDSPTMAFDMAASKADEDSPAVDDMGEMNDFGADVDAEHAHEEVDMSGFGDESDEVPSLDMPAEDDADMALAGTPHSDPASEASELTAEPRPQKRKPSMLAGLIIMSTSVPVAAIVAYAVLLWGAGMDPLGLGPKLPAILVPKALANPPGAAPRQVAQAMPGAPAKQNGNTDEPGGFDTNVPPLTPRADGTKPVDPTAGPKAGGAVAPDDADDAADDTMTDEPEPAVANPKKSKPAAADDAVDDEPADDMTADDATTDEPEPAVKTTKKTKPAAVDVAVDDEPADDTAMDDEPEPAVAGPKKTKPAADDTAMDDEPADDTAMGDEPEPAATGPKKSKPAVDDTAMDDEPAEATDPADDTEVATKPPVKVPGDDISAPEEDTEPAATDVVVGPHDNVHYSADDVEKGLTDAQAAGAALSAADKDGLKKAKAQYYRKLYQLAELATFSESGAADADGDSAKIQDLVAAVAADRARFNEVGKAAGKWIAVAKGKEHQGVMLAGSVQSVAKQGQVYETKILLTDGEQVVSVLSAQKLPVAEGDQAVVIGSIVSDPGTAIDGYQGTEETAVWSGMAVKASAG